MSKKNKKTDLWALMCPDDDQLLAEALAKTDEEVAESLQAKGYDLSALDAELLGLVAKLPSRHRGKRGYASVAALAATVTLGLLVSAIVATSIPASPPGELHAFPTAAASAPHEDSASNDAGEESTKGPSHPDRLDRNNASKEGCHTTTKKKPPTFRVAVKAPKKVADLLVFGQKVHDQMGANAVTLANLTPATTVTVRQRVFTKAGLSDWGQPVSHLVT